VLERHCVAFRLLFGGKVSHSVKQNSRRHLIPRNAHSFTSS